MKRLFPYTICLLLAFCFLTFTQARAQSQKAGYVDTDFILSKLPEYGGIQQQLQQLAQEWRSQLDDMQQEIDRLKDDFASKEILYTEEVKKQRQQEIQNKIEQREQYLKDKFGSKGEYFKKQQELLEPIQRKIFEAITKIANRDNFDFVFDRAQNTSLLFSRKKWNLNNEVLIELGITPDDTGN